MAQKGADLFKPDIITAKDITAIRQESAVQKAKTKLETKDVINSKLGLNKPKEAKEAKAPKQLSNKSAKVLAKAMDKSEDKKMFARKFLLLKKIRLYVKYEKTIGKDNIPPEAKKASSKMSEEELKEIHEAIRSSISSKAVKPACDNAILYLFFLLEYVIEDLGFNPLGFQLRGQKNFSAKMREMYDNGDLESEMTELAIEFGTIFESGPSARLAMKVLQTMHAVTLANRLASVDGNSAKMDTSRHANL